MKIADLKTVDLAEYLKTDKDRADFLADAIDAEHPELFARALDIVARSRGISDLARQTGLTRAGIYKAISEGANPSFDTVLRLLDALGVELVARPKQSHQKNGASGARRLQV
jgi:probable addiction module antidote protein